MMHRARRWMTMAAVAVTTTAAADTTLFVSPKGDDTNPGTRWKPFASVARARDAIRELRTSGEPSTGPITVWIKSGGYPLSETLSFGKEDSGTKEAPIVYRSKGRQGAWLRGGTAAAPELFGPATDPDILERLPEEARGKVLAASLADIGIADYVKELPDRFSGFTRVEPPFVRVYCNGEQMQWARWPNEGFAVFDEIIDVGSGIRDHEANRAKRYRPGIFSYTGDRPERWNVEKGVWMMGFWARAYLCEVVRAGKIDTDAKQITWKTSLHYGLDVNGAKRWYAFNLPEELDLPGEWYIDRNKGVLYFWPPEPIQRCDVVLSRLKTAMVGFENAEHITLKGLGLEGGIGDAVDVKGGRGIRLESCEIRNVGHHGVVIKGGHDHQVLGCDIHHVGYSAVTMEGGDRKTLEPANFEAVNNHIYETSQIKRTHTCAFSLKGVGMRVAHNLIHHVPHSAIFYGGNDLVMEYNDIYWCHYETAEGGVFYCGYNWTYRGNVIANNYIHHINDEVGGSPSGVNVVHLDDCVSGTEFSGNVVYRVGRGVSMCGGPFNVVDNNLFIDCQVGASLSARGLAWWTWTKHEDGTVTARDTRASHGYSTNNGLLKRLKEVPWDREPYTKYPHQSELLSVDTIGAPWWNAITRNISINGPVKNISRAVKPEWVTVADNWDSIDDGDPGIVAPYAEDYRLRPDAPALKIGFKPIPFDKIGLVKDDTRRSWPVKPERPPKDWTPCWVRRQQKERDMPTNLPVLSVRRATADITIDGVFDPEEWIPGEKQTVTVNIIKPAVLMGSASGGKSKSPCKAYIEVDDENLYVAFLNTTDPEGGIVGGHTWGGSDAVEISMSVVENREPGPIMLWRGYTDGHFETSDESLAPRAVRQRIMEGTQYGCKIVDRGNWTCEWKIPFTAIGIQPATLNPQILFNLSVRQVSPNEWTTWKKEPGGSWDVRRGGLLWLEPFGDITFGGGLPSQVRVEIFAVGDGMLIDPGENVETCTWAKPVGTRLKAVSGELKGDQWRDFEFTFTPKSDGQARLQLRGRPYNSETDKLKFFPIWTYSDDLRVEGAELVNGHFEELDAKTGQPVGWECSASAVIVSDAGAGETGGVCVKTWFLAPVTQTVAVKAGVPVTVRLKVRGEQAE